MAALEIVLAGKIIETIGAAFLAWVGIKVAYLEWFIGRHLIKGNEGKKSSSSVAAMRESLEKAKDSHRKNFGPTEALCVGCGAVFILLGCVIYIVGISLEIKEHNQASRNHTGSHAELNP